MADFIGDSPLHRLMPGHQPGAHFLSYTLEAVIRPQKIGSEWQEDYSAHSLQFLNINWAFSSYWNTKLQ